MINFEKLGIRVPATLLPKPEIDMKKWSVIACDQYTSEPSYWNQLSDFVGDAPSTLHMILTEVFLGKENQKAIVQKTHAMMDAYLQQGILAEHQGFILVERTIRNQTTQKSLTRNGLILALDLEQYDFNQGSQSLIRATEGTILDRLPPRMKIRRGAALEMPHILVLIDDPEQTVIEPLIAKRNMLETLYDFELYADSGHLTGHLINAKEDLDQIAQALFKLASPHNFYQKYNVSSDNHQPLLFAMGDGNHSLATAKAIWEEIKAEVGMDHPARYALVEIENVHDDALVFEPIHRIITRVNGQLEEDLKGFYPGSVEITPCSSKAEMIQQVDQQTGEAHQIGWIHQNQYALIKVNHPQDNLPAGTLQNFLDDWKSKGKFEDIDYVHGAEVVISLANQPDAMGFYLPAMKKDDLFKTVILDGSLPRKTFSMGEAREKRFYLECRKIIK